MAPVGLFGTEILAKLWYYNILITRLASTMHALLTTGSQSICSRIHRMISGTPPLPTIKALFASTRARQRSVPSSAATWMRKLNKSIPVTTYAIKRASQHQRAIASRFQHCKCGQYCASVQRRRYGLGERSIPAQKAIVDGIKQFGVAVHKDEVMQLSAMQLEAAGCARRTRARSTQRVLAPASRLPDPHPH